jgi:hypothetical protein
MFMNTLDIQRALRKDAFSRMYFKAVLPKDKLPSRVRYPSAYVINTHASDKPGEHWLAIFYDDNGVATFFDSFGQSPAFYKLKSFLLRTSRRFNHNTRQLQSIQATTCGFYCVYFIQLMSRSLTLSDILELFSGDNFNENDKRIYNI